MQARHKLLVRSVEDNAAVLAAGLELKHIHHGQRGVLDADDIGVLQHFAENVKADGHAGGAGNVVENEGQMRRFNHGVPVIHDAVIRLGEVVGRH